MPGSISIPKAKVLLLALHDHDSYFKMLDKKIFLSTNSIKLKPRFPIDQSVSICVQRIYRSDWLLVTRSQDLFPGFCLPWVKEIGNEVDKSDSQLVS